jgi:hypothetical protein
MNCSNALQVHASSTLPHSGNIDTDAGKNGLQTRHSESGKATKKKGRDDEKLGGSVAASPKTAVSSSLTL